MSEQDMSEHNQSLCCVCMTNEGESMNFSYWKCDQHAESICTICRDHILSQGRNASNCPMCRAVPLWHDITKKNSQCYIDNTRMNGETISDSLESIIIDYINTNTDEIDNNIISDINTIENYNFIRDNTIINYYHNNDSGSRGNWDDSGDRGNWNDPLNPEDTPINYPFWTTYP